MRLSSAPGNNALLGQWDRTSQKHFWGIQEVQVLAMLNAHAFLFCRAQHSHQHKIHEALLSASRVFEDQLYGSRVLRFSLAADSTSPHSDQVVSTNLVPPETQRPDSRHPKARRPAQKNRNPAETANPSRHFTSSPKKPGGLESNNKAQNGSPRPYAPHQKVTKGAAASQVRDKKMPEKVTDSPLGNGMSPVA